jgi:hypothetical protein
MNPEAGNNHRPAVFVEARIVYEGEQPSKIEAAVHVGRIVGFAYALTAIGQAAVAEHKTDASQTQILTMVLAQAAVDEGRANPICLTVPGVPDRSALKETVLFISLKIKDS